MTARRAGTGLVLLTGAALLAAACGSNAATTAPTQVATQAPVTQAPPSEAPGSSEVPGSFALPSFHGDVDLENMIPDEIGGEAITTQSMTGQQFLGAENNEFTAVLGGLGKQPSDLSVAFGFTAQISIIAFQINGVPGSAILEAFKNSTADIGTLTDANYGGKSVKKVTPTDTSQDITYIYTTQDVVFVVSGSTLTEALLNEAFSKLP